MYSQISGENRPKCLVFLASFLLALTAGCASNLNGQASQNKEMQAWSTPYEGGFDADALEQTRQFADKAGSGGVVAISQGRVIASWGDVSRAYNVRSVRKSLMSGLVGAMVDKELLDLNDTLSDFGVDDLQPLTQTEKQARLKDLIAARSGVFLPSAYAAQSQDDTRPDRGSHAPGTHWFYNNWDFNVVGVIIEKSAPGSLFEVFDKHIAQPLGMVDFDPADGLEIYEPSQSMHPALAFRISTRDLARFGQLYVQRGAWNGNQIFPSAWVDESLSAVTDLGDGRGYGYMWWTYEPGSISDNYPSLAQHRVVLGRGTGGQTLFIVPEAELVIAHTVDTDNGERVRGGDVWQIAENILSAKVGTANPAKPSAPVQTTAFTDRTSYPRQVFVELPAEVRTSYVGEYNLGRGAVAKVFEWNDRLFGNFPGYGEAQLFALSDDKFTILVAPAF